MDLFEFSCDLKQVETTPEEIINVLPQWKTRVLEATKLDVEENVKTIKLRLLINAKTVENVKSWIKEYQDRTLCTYYIRDTPLCKGRYLLFKQRLNCHHNTKTWNVTDPAVVKRKRRNTNCPSYMKVTLYSPVKINKKYVRKHIPDAEMPCEIILIPTHNHEVNNAEALGWRRVSNDVKQKLLYLYDRGHNASTAREIIKLDIYTNDNLINISDRKFCPDYNYCYNLYRKYVKNKPINNANNNNNFEQLLIERLEEYNDSTNDDSCRFFQYGGNYVMCVCPPMFRRVHQNIKACKDVVFLDSIKSNESQKITDKSQMYILLTPSECGGLPLAIIITSENTYESLSNGFEILKDMLGDKLFGGKTEGPKIFITDDNIIEREAVKKSWPSSINLLCIYHVLKSIFNWLVKIKNSIGKTEQQLFFQDFRSIMFAKNKIECLVKYNEARLNAKDYPNYLKLLEEYWNRKNLWALSYRSYFLSEAALRLLKEQIFERIKSFNTLQTVDFILTKFMSYYQNKLLDAAGKNEINYFKDTEYEQPPEHISKRIQNLGNKLFLVPCDEQENLFFVVNTDILSCSCSNSSNGENCKHIEWLLAIQPVNKTIPLMDDNDMRDTFYYIATGDEKPGDTNVFNTKTRSKSSVNIERKTGSKTRQRKILPKLGSDVQCLLVVTTHSKIGYQSEGNENKGLDNVSIENVSIQKRKDTEDVLKRIQDNLKRVLDETPGDIGTLKKFNERLEQMKHVDVIKGLETFGTVQRKRKVITTRSVPIKKRRKPTSSS